MMRMPDWSRGRLFFLLLFAVAWPWEIFQRIPILGGTVGKLGRVGLYCLGDYRSVVAAASLATNRPGGPYRTVGGSVSSIGIAYA